ncbi:hypothetical protein L1887_53396 [Cichorium endivia]|nr:hypothetical protein L1887_53396 [Cichorium endivia]
MPGTRALAHFGKVAASVRILDTLPTRCLLDRPIPLFKSSSSSPHVSRSQALLLAKQKQICRLFAHGKASENQPEWTPSTCMNTGVKAV